MTAAAGPARRLVFANQLRGAAALMVVLVHYTVVVQTLRPDVAWVVAAPPLDTRVAAVALWLRALPVDLGSMGVGLFFLISGFVIPFSLEGTTGGGFLLARAARILPTFWAALLLEYAAVAASSAYWHRPAAYAWQGYVVNGLLIETLAGRQTVDWVSWTLSIEAKFYLLAALCRTPLLRGGLRFPFLCAAAALALNAAVGQGLAPVSRELDSESIFLLVILIGTLFHAHYAGRVSSRQLAAGTAGMLASMALCWRCGPLADETAARCISLSAAVAVFAAAYHQRGRFRPSRMLDAAAAVSYPLYLVHAVLGFTVISFLMMAWRVPYAVAAPAGFVLCLAAAAALHRFVEQPTMRWGRRAARRFPLSFIAAHPEHQARPDALPLDSAKGRAFGIHLFK